MRRTPAALMSCAYSLWPRLLICSGCPSISPPRCRSDHSFANTRSEIAVGRPVRHHQFALVLPMRRAAASPSRPRTRRCAAARSSSARTPDRHPASAAAGRSASCRRRDPDSPRSSRTVRPCARPESSAERVERRLARAGRQRGQQEGARLHRGPAVLLRVFGVLLAATAAVCDPGPRPGSARDAGPSSPSVRLAAGSCGAASASSPTAWHRRSTARVASAGSAAAASARSPPAPGRSSMMPLYARRCSGETSSSTPPAIRVSQSPSVIGDVST